MGEKGKKFALSGSLYLGEKGNADQESISSELSLQKSKMSFSSLQDFKGKTIANYRMGTKLESVASYENFCQANGQTCKNLYKMLIQRKLPIYFAINLKNPKERILAIHAFHFLILAEVGRDRDDALAPIYCLGKIHHVYDLRSNQIFQAVLSGKFLLYIVRSRIQVYDLFENTSLEASLKGKYLLLRPAHQNEMKELVDMISYGTVFKALRILENQKFEECIVGSIDRYIVEKLLGKGGMGCVFKAYDPKTDRTLAFKITLIDLRESSELQRRFDTEIKIQAKLDRHDSIASIYDCGILEIGEKIYPYLTMEYIEGIDLKTWLEKQQEISCVNAAEIICKIAQALFYVHGQNIIHRDLKLANIMLRKSDPRRPCLMDFGLAKSTDYPQYSQDGALIGTPLYMSPEQVKGEKIDHRVDQYSLAICLYELLTGKIPFSPSQNLHSLYRRIREETPVPPSQMRENLPKTLENICLKALEKNRENRYPSLKEFIFDLKCFLDGKSVKVKKIKKSPKRRLARGKVSRKNRWIFPVLSISLLLIVSIIIFSQKKETFQKRGLVKSKKSKENPKTSPASKEKIQAKLLKIDALLIQGKAKRSEIVNYIQARNYRLAYESCERAFAHAREAKKILYDLSGRYPKRKKENLSFLLSLQRIKKYQILPVLPVKRSEFSIPAGHMSCIVRPSFDYTARRQIVSKTQEQIEIWSVRKKILLQKLLAQPYSQITCLSFYGEKYFAYGTNRGHVFLYQLSPFKKIAQIELVAKKNKSKYKEIRSIAFDQNKNLFVSNISYTMLYHIQTHEKVFLKNYGDKNADCLFGPKGEWLVVKGSNSRASLLFRTENLWRKVFTRRKLSMQARAFRFSPDRNLLAYGVGNDLKLYDLKKKKEYRTFAGHKNQIQQTSWSPDNRLLVSLDARGMMIVWGVEKGEKILEMSIKDARSISIASKRGKNFLRIWTVQKAITYELEPSLGRKFSPPMQAKSILKMIQFRMVNSNIDGVGLEMNPRNEKEIIGYVGPFILGCYGKSIGQLGKQYEPSISFPRINITQRVKDMTFSSDGKLAAAVSKHHCQIWDMSDSKKIRLAKLYIGKRAGNCLAFHPKDSNILFIGKETFVLVLKFQRKKNSLKLLQKKTLPGSLNAKAICLNSEGTFLAAGGDNGFLLWKFRHKRLQADLFLSEVQKEINDIRALSFTSANTLAIAAGDTKSTLILWDYTKLEGNRIVHQKDWNASIKKIGYNPREKLYEVISNLSIVLYDPKTQENFELLPGYSKFPANISQNRYLAFRSKNFQVLLFDIGLRK